MTLLRLYKLSLITVCALTFSGLLAPSHAKDVRVAKGGAISTLGAGIAKAGHNGVVYLAPGTYYVNDLTIPFNISIVGETDNGGEVILTSRRAVAKGLLVPTEGASLAVRNVTFDGAVSPDKNGAGIRFEGKLLRLDHCIFSNNEDGILATGHPKSVVKISHTKFINNGHGDGFSHAMYIRDAVKLIVEDSYFEGTNIGHHIKSMATQTIVRNNVFIDGPNKPSYMVDITKGGSAVIEGNTMTRARTASQETLINYDTTRGGTIGSLIIRDNIIKNAKPRGRLLRNPEKAPVDLQNNTISNIKNGTLALPGELQMAEGQSQAQAQNVQQEAYNDGQYTQEQLDNLTPKQRKMVERMTGSRKPVGVQTASAASPLAVTSSNAAYTDDETTAPDLPADVTIESAQVVAESAAQGLDDQSKPARKLRGFGRRQKTQNTAKAGAPLVDKSTRGLVTLPEYAALSQSNDVAAFNLVRLTGRNRVSPFVTFGQIFKRGQVFPTTNIEARFGEEKVAAQMTAKALYSDGSVRHGAIAVVAPASTKRSLQGVLIKAPKTTPAPKLLWPSEFDLIVQIDGQTADKQDFSKRLNLRTLPQTTWMSGPLATTYMVDAMAGPLLRVRGDITVFANKTIRSRLSFENHHSFAKGNRDLAYRVKIYNGDQILLNRGVPNHYRGSNWSETLWKGTLPAWEYQADALLLRETAAIPPYDFSFGIDQAGIATQSQTLGVATRSVFEAYDVTKYMPSTGSRADIGPLPLWDVYALKTMNRSALASQRKRAGIGGAIPWHFADDTTGLPIRVDQHPLFWAEQRGSQERRGKDRIPESYFAGGDGGWTAELAHKPAMAYTAYLLTADPYFAREVAHEAAFAIASVWPEKRAGTSLVIGDPQLRARAWGLRDIGNAAFILPDDNPLKDYFTTSLALNLKALMKTYVLDGAMDHAGKTEGYFKEKIDKDPLRISPWQNDYMVASLTQEALRGSTLAGELIDWTANFQIGRILAKGAEPKLGVSYALNVYTGIEDQLHSEWASVTAATKTRTENAVYPSAGDGYVASAYASLANVYSVTGNTDAVKAIKVLLMTFPEAQLWQTSNIEGFARTPTWLFATKTPAGAWLSADQAAR